MPSEIKEQIEFHRQKCEEYKEKAKKCAKYADEFERDIRKISETRDMRTAAENFEIMAFNELEKMKNIEYDSCHHVWFSSVASGTAFTDYCVKCDLMFSTPRIKRAPQRITSNIMNDIKKINSFYMSKVGVNSHDEFVKYMSRNGVVVNLKVKKYIAKKIIATMVDLYPYLSDEEIVRKIEKNARNSSQDSIGDNGIAR